MSSGGMPYVQGFRVSQSGGHAAPGGMHSHPSAHGGAPLPGPGAMPAQAPTAQDDMLPADKLPKEKPDQGQAAEDGSGDASNHSDSVMKPIDPHDIHIMDNTECKFKVNSFKMFYVVNSESYLYKRLALQRARESHRTVSLAMHKKFLSWVDSWLNKNTDSKSRSMCDSWLMGTDEDMDIKECTTRLSQDNDISKTPYFTYSRYIVRAVRGDVAQAEDLDEEEEETEMDVTE